MGYKEDLKVIESLKYLRQILLPKLVLPIPCK